MTAKAKKTKIPKEPANLVKAKTTLSQISEKSPRAITASGGEAPVLRFSTVAWLKIMHCRDCYHEEIAAYAISAADDLLYVEDIWIPKQVVSCGSFEFDTDHVTEVLDWFFTEHGVEPYRCSRIWIHTHPSGVTGPSGTDETTFKDIFGNFTWSVMVIFPKACETPYAAMTINQKGLPAFRVKIPVVADYLNQETALDLDTLKATIQENVIVEHLVYAGGGSGYYGGNYGYGGGWPDRHNDVADLFKNREGTGKFDLMDIDEDEFPFIGVCMICEDPGVAVNNDNICALCMAEHSTGDAQVDEFSIDNFSKKGRCIACEELDVYVNKDSICYGCAPGCEVVEETEVSAEGQCAYCDAYDVPLNSDDLCATCMELFGLHKESS